MEEMDLKKREEDLSAVQVACQIEFRSLAFFSFREPSLAEDKINTLKQKGEKNSTSILEYIDGKMYYIPPYAGQWVKTLEEKQEEKRLELVREIIAQAKNQWEARMWLESYEEYLNWCNCHDKEEFHSVFSPICFECGAVITSGFTNCPCCGSKLKKI